MTAKDALKHNVEFCHMVTTRYLSDFSDADLMVRAAPGANHTAWQLGHLVSSAHGILTALGHRPPALPAGFAESHTKETSASDDPARFRSRDEYVRLLGSMKDATLAALQATPEADLDKPAPESFRRFFPTVAACFHLLGTHPMMHAGQIVSVRRKLGKPVLI